MTGNIVDQMCSGIDNAQIIIVFVTQNYMQKVGGNNTTDNCKLEFNYALRVRKPELMISVVMEPRMRDTSKWKGVLGMALGGTLYVDFCDDDLWLDSCKRLYGEIMKKITPLYNNSVEIPTIIDSPIPGDQIVMTELNTEKAINDKIISDSTVIDTVETKEEWLVKLITVIFFVTN